MIFEIIPDCRTGQTTDNKNETPLVGIHLAYHLEDEQGRRLLSRPMRGPGDIDETINTLILELEKLRKLAKQYVS